MSQTKKIKLSILGELPINALLILSTYHEELDSLNVYELGNDLR